MGQGDGGTVEVGQGDNVLVPLSHDREPSPVRLAPCPTVSLPFYYLALDTHK